MIVAKGLASGSLVFFFSSRRRHTRWPRDWSSDVCSSDLAHGKGSATLHFEVKPEYHINSHKPSNELLIPTELATPQGPVKLTAQYPEGHDILLLGTEKVNVYSGKFRSEERRVGKDGTSTG